MFLFDLWGLRFWVRSCPAGDFDDEKGRNVFRQELRTGRSSLYKVVSQRKRATGRVTPNNKTA